MHESAVVTTVLGIIGLLLVAAIAAIALKRLKMPYTVGLVIVGLLLRLLVGQFHQLEPLASIELSPDLIFFIFLPTLIFESAFNLNARLLAQNLTPVLALAAPGLLLSTAIVGALVALFTPLTLGPALVFGALISATDPVAVVALFKEVGAPKRLAVLIEGESLFNDATAIVLFQIIVTVATGAAFGASIIGTGTLDFLRVFFGGLVIGGLIGYLMIWIISHADSDPLVEVAFSTVVAYAAFIVAEHNFHVSGVMSTVGAGLVVGTMGSTRFSKNVREYLHQFWEYAAFVANSLIFLLVGLSLNLGELSAYLGPISVAIVAGLLARALVVFGLIPLVTRLSSTRIDLRYQTVMFWGGLRGAVAIALVLSLSPDFPFRDLIAAMAVGVVIFSLVAGGLTMGPLIRKLGLADPSLADLVGVEQATIVAKNAAAERLKKISVSGHFSSSMVADLLADCETEIAKANRRMDDLRHRCSPSDMKKVLWTQALSIERTNYREMFEHGAITGAVLQELELAVDLTQDALRLDEAGMEDADLDRSATPLEERIANVGIRLVKLVAPNGRTVQRHQLASLAAKYEHDTAVALASRRVVTQLDQLAASSGIDPEITRACEAVWEKRRAAAIGRIDSVAEHFPEFASAVQFRTASRIAFEGEAEAVDDLASSGAIPEFAAAQSRKQVEQALQRLASQPVDALEPEPSELLAKVPFFATLEQSDRKRVVDKLAPRTVLAGTDIITQGEKGSSLFLISRGVVSVHSKQPQKEFERVASFHAGQFFGEMALLRAEPRSATVRAVTDCQLYELSRESVEELYGVCPSLESALERAAKERSG